MTKVGGFDRARLKVAAKTAVLLSALLVLPTFSQAQKFVVAWSAVSALNSPFWVMNDGGFWKQEGLDIQLVYIASSPTVARATLAGEIVFSGANSQVIVDVGLGGGDLVAMGGDHQRGGVLRHGGAGDQNRQ